MAAHRYWRILNYINGGNGETLSQIAELEMRITAGGATQTTGGTAISTGSIQAGTAQGAFNADGVTTFIQFNGTGGQSVGYDFGVGVTKDIIEIAVTGATGAAARTFNDFVVQSSDDNSTWNDEWWVSYTGSSWVSGTAVVFTKPAVANHRHWRLRAQTVQSASVFSITEIEFHATAGGANNITGGTASQQSTFGAQTANLAVDGNTATYSATNGLISADVQWWKYDYGSGNSVAVNEVKYQNRNDGTGQTQAPTNFQIESGTDGFTFIKRFSGTFATWSTTGQIQTVTGPATAARRRQLCLA